MESVKLKQERAQVYAAMKDLRAKADPETGNFSDPTAEAAWRKADSDFIDFTRKIEEAEKWEARERQMAESEFEAREKDKKAPGKPGGEDTYERAFEVYARRGKDALTDVQRRLLETRGTSTQATTPDGLGGYIVPEGFSGEVERIMKYYGPMLDVPRILTTASGNPLPWPTLNDTSATGEQKTEATGQMGVEDMTFGVVTFGSYTADSKIVKISEELLQDEGVSLGSILGEVLAERLGRQMNTKLTIGTGTNEANGVVTAAALGKEAAAHAAFTKAELIDLFHSVDKSYRTGPKVGFMMNDQILSFARKLDIGNGDSVQIFAPSIIQGEPDRLLGSPVWINNDMASVQAQSSKIILFGDFNKYLVRRIGGVRIKRFNELYADYLVVGFAAWGRYDGDIIAPGSIKYMINKTN